MVIWVVSTFLIIMNNTAVNTLGEHNFLLFLLLLIFIVTHLNSFLEKQPNEMKLYHSKFTSNL